MYNEETIEFYHNWDLAIAKDAGFNEGKSAGFSEGAKSSKLEIAKNLLKLDVPTKDICTATGLTKKEVDSLKD